MRKIKYDFSKLRGKICEEYKCISNFSKRTIYRIHSTALASALKAYERIYLKK